LFGTALGLSGRNRPYRFARRGASHPERELVEGALRAGCATGLDPDVVAARALDAVRTGRFYVLPPENDPWRKAMGARLDMLREGGDLRLALPGVDN
jgi:hypothetical protein